MAKATDYYYRYSAGDAPSLTRDDWAQFVDRTADILGKYDVTAADAAMLDIIAKHFAGERMPFLHCDDNLQETAQAIYAHNVERAAPYAEPAPHGWDAIAAD